jgi:molybdopterin biosynthesis enzyme
MTALMPVAEALGPVLASLVPLKPVTLPVADALGRVLAEDVRAPCALPRRPEALRQGFAVASRSTIGAAAQSPVMLATTPMAVTIGDALPEGCDAVVPHDAVSKIGRAFAVTQPATPGEAVRLIGHDVAAGEIIAGRGAVLTAEHRLILQCAGINAVPVVEPRVALDAGAAPAVVWLEATLAALGCRVCASGEADIAISSSESGEPRLALQPGASAAISRRDGESVAIALPQRFDGLMTGFLALVLPLIAVLSHRQIRLDTKPLAQKVVSMIGTTDCVLLKTTPQGFMPVSSGEITLAALAGSDAFALMPPESEGVPAGQPIAATPFNAMLEEQTTQ